MCLACFDCPADISSIVKVGGRHEQASINIRIAWIFQNLDEIKVFRQMK